MVGSTSKFIAQFVTSCKDEWLVHFDNTIAHDLDSEKVVADSNSLLFSKKLCKEYCPITYYSSQFKIIWINNFDRRDS
jgi:hypothetical protein